MKYKITQCDQYGFSKNLTPCIYNPPVKIGSFFCSECPNCLNLDKENSSIECNLYDSKIKAVNIKIVAIREKFIKDRLTLKDLILAEACNSSLKWLVQNITDTEINFTPDYLISFLKSNNRDADAAWISQYFKSETNEKVVFLEDCSKNKVYAYVGLDNTIFISTKDSGTFKWINFDIDTSVLSHVEGKINLSIQELLINTIKRYDIVFEFNNLLDVCKWIIYKSGCWE